MTGLTRQVEARAVDRADCVFAESHSTLACLAKRVAGNRLFLGPPGVDTGFFQPRGTDSSGFILAVGRFSDPRKNVRLLLEAYARLCRSSASVPRLVLAGTPPSSDGMAYLSTAGISDRVEVCSNVSQETLAGLYREAGLFVLSSDEEGLGIVILEAMASGLPVVSTDCGGPATAVAAGETGLLSPVGDVDALAENMARLLGNPGLRARMGRAGRQVAVERFSLPVTGKVYLDKYDDLLQNRPLALGAAA
jgi:glycosyltransferase involved in cell wall biosynthesis